MAIKSITPVKITEKGLTITRMFDAPPSQVWKAWTDLEQVKRWWGPQDFTAPIAKIDLRIGGKYLFCMRSPDGKDYYSTGVYREITAPERLIYTDNFADAGGNIVPASYYGMQGNWAPDGLTVTVTLEEPEKGKTLMTLVHNGMPMDESKNAAEGWNQSFDKLAKSLRY